MAKYVLLFVNNKARKEFTLYSAEEVFAEVTNKSFSWFILW